MGSIPLEENFRSSQGIVETAPAFIKWNKAPLSEAMTPSGAQTTESGDIVALRITDPDTVRIMTIHQAKGMQWPVVFVPALLKNRFRTKKAGGRIVWHLLPRVEQTLQLSLAQVERAVRAGLAP